MQVSHCLLHVASILEAPGDLGWRLYQFGGAAVTKCHTLGDSDNKSELSHGSGGWKSQARCQQGWLLMRAVREGLFQDSLLRERKWPLSACTSCVSVSNCFLRTPVISDQGLLQESLFNSTNFIRTLSPNWRTL